MFHYWWPDQDPDVGKPEQHLKRMDGSSQVQNVDKQPKTNTWRVSSGALQTNLIWKLCIYGSSVRLLEMQSDSDKFSAISQLERHWRSEISFKGVWPCFFWKLLSWRGSMIFILCYILYACTPASLIMARPRTCMRLLESFNWFWWNDLTVFSRVSGEIPLEPSPAHQWFTSELLLTKQVLKFNTECPTNTHSFQAAPKFN